MAGQRTAIIVANDTYDNEWLRRLEAPSGDAESLGRILDQTDIGAFDSVQTLLNQPHHTVKQAIEGAFVSAGREDTILLFFSGHGVKDERGRLHLATRNTEQHRLRSTAVEAGFIDDVMGSSRAKRQILILDCCYSGAFPSGAAAKSDTAMHVEEHFDSGGTGRVVLSSSDAMQYSFEGDELVEDRGFGSVFTQVLVRGLETGEADLDNDGKITVDELYDYVFDGVRAATPHQRPQKASSAAEGEIVIARNPFSAERLAEEEARQRALAEKIERLRAQLHDAELAAESSVSEVRLGAVSAIARIARDARLLSPDVYRSAGAALARLEFDDNEAVSRAARDRVLELSGRADQVAPSDHPAGDRASDGAPQEGGPEPDRAGPAEHPGSATPEPPGRSEPDAVDRRIRRRLEVPGVVDSVRRRIERLAGGDDATEAGSSDAPSSSPAGEPIDARPQPRRQEPLRPEPAPRAKATTASPVAALVVGIVGLFFIGATGPVAWWMARRNLREIGEGRRPPEERAVATAAKVIGIIGTAILVLVVMAALVGA